MKSTKKICYVCGRRKQLAVFHKNRSKLDGRADECAKCRMAYQRKHRQTHQRRMRSLRVNSVSEERVEAVRRLLATEPGKYWLPSDRVRCVHGNWEEICPLCERSQRAGMAFAHEESEVDT